MGINKKVWSNMQQIAAKESISRESEGISSYKTRTKTVHAYVSTHG
jgi:hypothetical protein